VSEKELVERVQRGDLSAFEELIRPYEKKVFNLAYRMCGSVEDAKDLAQEAIVRAFSGLSSFRGDASFSTWLYRIASNACLDELRRRKRQPADYLDEPVITVDGEIRRQVADPSQNPLEVVERSELQQIIQDSLTSLPEEYRVVVVLREIQGFSYQEIAEILNCSLGTVKSRLNRARKALKEKFTVLELFPSTSVSKREEGGRQ